MVPPGRSAPEASAASTIRSAIRSFTEPPGLKYSTLASTAGAWPPPTACVTARSRTSGVFPTSSIRDSWTCIATTSNGTTGSVMDARGPGGPARACSEADAIPADQHDCPCLAHPGMIVRLAVV